MFIDFVERIVKKVSPIRGVNIGGGNWKKAGWINFDMTYSLANSRTEKLNKDSKLRFTDNTLKFVFSSHFFEHIDDETARNLIFESYRILRRGGVLRIAVPDFDLAKEKYLAGDHNFFDKGSW